MRDYILPSVSNGNPREQALIRRWWYESEGGRGTVVWEYYLEGRYADAIVFLKNNNPSEEVGGTETPKRFPLRGSEVVVCEAKVELTPELIGQTLVYTRFAIRAGAKVRETMVFAERASKSLEEVAADLNLRVIVRALDSANS
jgi:hypothetical protein